ncbi:AI-2E family transporter [Candidatus Chrysopegis kryptomonas]|uniref:Predicted PurR-regulated permease PerM n=1 Tax=Candidatus Chryseopegocella kryptomonas TaxID=1633643 RepID=A0A0P1MSQ8_9BACT|nr:AI-2E family transporter [Candidatus Chrysopegis kryptomonas]CUS98738.1 Predicted PurR-regulated permease PerM [Candidatus Chrysopegis kryptomonas]
MSGKIWRNLFVFIGIPTITLFIVWIASIAIHISLIVILAIFLAVALNPLVIHLESIGVNRTASILIVFASLILILILSIVFLIPKFVNQFKTLAEQLQKVPLDVIIASAIQSLKDKIPLLKGLDLEHKVQELVAIYSVKAASALTSAITTVFELLLAPFVAFFILKDGERFKKKLIRAIPNRYFEMGLNVLDKIEAQITGYIRGLVLEATALGIMSAIGSAILGINFAFVIGLIAGLASFVPYLGAFVGAIPALLISVVQFGDGRMILPLIIMFVIVHLIDDLVVQPLVYSHSVGMHPVEVVFVLLIFGELFGLFGMLIAIPVEAIIKVSVKEIYWGLTHYKITIAKRDESFGTT